MGEATEKCPRCCDTANADDREVREAEAETERSSCCCRHKKRSEEEYKSLIHRLNRIEGQIRGIQAMIRRGEECEAIAQQFAAARKALDKAYQEMLACLLEETVLDPARDDAETLARVRAIFTKYT